MRIWGTAGAAIGLALALVACGRSSDDARVSARKLAAERSENALANLSTTIANANAELRALRSSQPASLDAGSSEAAGVTVIGIKGSGPQSCGLHGAPTIRMPGDNSPASILERRIAALESKLLSKRTENNLEQANRRLLAEQMADHTSLYNLSGSYRVMVIPVQFSDVRFERPEFVETEAQEYLFGNHKNSLSNYYRHASLGKFQVDGEVTPIITVDGSLADYGEAVTGRTDKAARELVVQALAKLKESKTDEDWWFSFDNWDLNDYDLDSNRHEPDGFIDAVVLIYAGKSQAACQASFDTDRTRPPSSEVPEGPRHDAAVECYNRIWPHRWAISLASDDPRYSDRGPIVEGSVRPSMNGFKINDHLFALDYNMQSEYSDRSTFIHEFGHSLTLPDVYASQGEGNSTGSWDVMSGNAHLQAQELSSYSKISLGWLEPKIVAPGQSTSAYLGAYNFVTNQQRDNNANYFGPEKVLENFAHQAHSYDVLSSTPGFGESVYRSIVALMPPTPELVQVVETDASLGERQGYSGRFDGDSRSYTRKIRVPEQGSAELKFEKIHFIETETNFDTNEEEIKVVVDYDIGEIWINGELKEKLRTISGDANSDTLAEANPNCAAEDVLRLRLKGIRETLSDSEKAELAEKREVCSAPVWETKSFDLSAYRGQEVEFEIRYTTDAGYTEFGIVFDNLRLGDQLLEDFESTSSIGQFVFLERGVFEKNYNQFYLFEYRDPLETFTQDGQALGYNMDENIRIGNQSMFLSSGASLRERFRLIQQDYQPGVLVWYFNSRFDRQSNSPEVQEGKGYLLVLNANTGEKILPGELGRADLRNESGEYDVESPVFKNFVDEQRRLFKCFGAVAYYTYIDGVAPNCGDVAVEEINAMRSLYFGDLSLVARREGFNEYLPIDQYAFAPVGVPMRLFAGLRTGLSTFNPPEAPAFRPYKVYRAEENQMVLDAAITDAAESFPPVATFSDADSVLPENPRFHGDTVVVEKKGFAFSVQSPSPRITRLYRESAGPDENDNYYRRPRVKIVFTKEN